MSEHVGARLVSGLQAEDGPSVEIGLHSGRELAIAQATMKPDFRKLVVLELDVRKRAASPALQTQPVGASPQVFFA